MQVYTYTNPERNDLRHASIHKGEIYMIKLSFVKNKADASRNERLRVPINYLGSQNQYSRKEDRVEIYNLLFFLLKVKNKKYMKQQELNSTNIDFNYCVSLYKPESHSIL